MTARPLRIAVWHNLPSGGGKRQLYGHVAGLVARGHHVESWCPDTADQAMLPLGRLVTEHVIPLQRVRGAFRLPVRPRSVVRELLGVLDAHGRAAAREIALGGFDVLYANACTFLRTTPIARHAALPSALYLGEPYRWFYEALPALPWIDPLPERARGGWLGALRARRAERALLDGMRLQARAERDWAGDFDALLVNSLFSRETLLRAYGREAEVCALGIDTELFRPGGAPREHLVVGLGTIYHGKGVDRAIRAVGALPRAIRPELAWIGNGAVAGDLEAYTRLAGELGVTFTPRLDVTDAEVVGLLGRAKALLYTSRLEPFGLAPLEANACGTPVVGIAEGGIRESVRDGVNGFLAPTADPEVLAGLLERLLESPELVETMGRRAREHVVEAWSMEASIDRLEARLVALAASARA